MEDFNEGEASYVTSIHSYLRRLDSMLNLVSTKVDVLESHIINVNARINELKDDFDTYSSSSTIFTFERLNNFFNKTFPDKLNSLIDNNSWFFEAR